jgi:hypothetical protein
MQKFSVSDVKELKAEARNRLLLIRKARYCLLTCAINESQDHAPETASYIRQLLMTVIKKADEASKFALDIFRSLS